MSVQSVTTGATVTPAARAIPQVSTGASVTPAIGLTTLRGIVKTGALVSPIAKANSASLASGRYRR